MASLHVPHRLQALAAPVATAKQSSQFLELSSEQRNKILKQCATGVVGVPTLHFDTVKYRRGPSQEAKDHFRLRMLNRLRQGWSDPNTEAQFLKLASLVETEGCALFGGLIDVPKFQKLIEDYETIQNNTGSQNFLHSYVNLSNDPDFIRNSEYNDAFVHPLLVTLIAYQMGGAIRIIDIRGKDTKPMSANAQDNMLHIDNTPFKDEYKVLLVWKQGEVKGPSGQNFTYLPGTHRGNREIHLDASGVPYSTEKENLFSSHEAIDGLIDFQKQAIEKCPVVVEVEYPEQPLSMLFSAGGLVHHRYRNEYGDARSCISAAFHLASDNPGALLMETHDDNAPKSLFDFLSRYQDSDSDDTFLSLLPAAAQRVEVKIAELFSPSGFATLVDTSGMSLSEKQLQDWREVVVAAPLASSIKFSREVFLSDVLELGDDYAIETLVSAMMYDKHGLLQLILYEDGHEEIRKLCRKRIGEMRQDEIASRLTGWLPTLLEQGFTIKDIPAPADIREMAEHIASGGAAMLTRFETQPGDKTNAVMLASLVQMITDLAEAVVRCERLETYASTSLYLFWAVQDIVPFLEGPPKQHALSVSSVFLRNYVGFVLLLEAEQKAADTSA